MTAICILRGDSLYVMSIWVSASIVIFYVIGQMVRIYLSNKVFQKIQEQEDETQDEPGNLSEADYAEVTDDELVP
ncbi:MAG: hypothetical protein LBR83_09100 [Clostridiales bacterium]|nr:hypothetical protein [Clostridiales bacterium]